MAATFVETNKKYNNEKIFNFCQGGKTLAECVVFFWEKQIMLIHIEIVNSTTINQFIESLLVYAQTHKYRMIEYPLVIMYDDNTFLGDYHHRHDNHDDGFEYVYNDDDDMSSGYDIERKEEEAEISNLRNLKLFQNKRTSIYFDISQYVIYNFDYTQRVSVHAFRDGVGKCVPSSSIYVTLQILPDCKTFKQETTIIKIGCTHNLTTRINNTPYEYYTTGEALIYYKYKKDEETLNIDFDKSAVIVMNTTEKCIDDIYTQFSIGGITLANNSDHFRINKWQKYSDIEKYMLCSMNDFDNKNIVYLINSLCFPNNSIDKHYNLGDTSDDNDEYIDKTSVINYTSDVYKKLVHYAYNDYIKPSIKKHIKYAVIKKQEEIEKQEDIKKNRRKSHKTKKVSENNIQVVADENVRQENTDEITDNTVINFGYIYLIREREFLHNKEEVYKVGRTVQKGASLLLDRMKAYKKGSELCFMRQVLVDNVVRIETVVKTRFNQQFSRHPDGHEYFRGDMNNMIKVINQIIDN